METAFKKYYIGVSIILTNIVKRFHCIAFKNVVKKAWFNLGAFIFYRFE